MKNDNWTLMRQYDTHVGFSWGLLFLHVCNIQRFPKEHHRDAREGEVKANHLHDILPFKHVRGTADGHVGLFFVEHHHIDKCNQD